MDKETIIHLGATVFCDYCCEDFTNRNDTGGILFQSKAICPICAPAALKRIKGYGEERFIRGRCPEGMSFRDWVLSLSDGPRVIQIIESDKK